MKNKICTLLITSAQADSNHFGRFRGQALRLRAGGYVVCVRKNVCMYANGNAANCCATLPKNQRILFPVEQNGRLLPWMDMFSSNVETKTVMFSEDQEADVGDFGRQAVQRGEYENEGEDAHGKKQKAKAARACARRGAWGAWKARACKRFGALSTQYRSG
ncbi:hypothetical protein DFH08DRAFT_120669 [Mycena albidolilacea]|uniref:Uncharacterized protein n=1 Tax=Mycena albidolilacea TaxID=1033008 RepID=A0AAD6YXI1_9AGAR|nr:hypothetical protein DFH08DRAFT_120669 [Mycena albidolilacea]